MLIFHCKVLTILELVQDYLYLLQVAAVRKTSNMYIEKVNTGAASVPLGIALLGSLSSPEKIHASLSQLLVKLILNLVFKPFVTLTGWPHSGLD